MRQNSRIREQYELSLDGKQVAAIVVGALVVLGAVFVLGLNVGRQLAAAGAPPRPENPLAALDRQPTAAPAPPEKEPKLSFHEALTGGAAATPPIAEARPKADPAAPATGTALNASPRPPTPAPAPTATRAATATRTGTSPRAP